MSWSEWADSSEEREEYLWVVHNCVPYTTGVWGQPMFTLKYTSCEDLTRESCSCVMYNEEHPKSESIDFSHGAVWSMIMAQPYETLLNDQGVDDNM